MLRNARGGGVGGCVTQRYVALHGDGEGVGISVT